MLPPCRGGANDRMTDHVLRNAAQEGRHHHSRVPCHASDGSHRVSHRRGRLRLIGGSRAKRRTGRDQRPSPARRRQRAKRGHRSRERVAERRCRETGGAERSMRRRALLASRSASVYATRSTRVTIARRDVASRARRRAVGLERLAQRARGRCGGGTSPLGSRLAFQY